MKLAAITGSIGCGKTTLSKIVRRLGYVVYDIDGWVRRCIIKRILSRLLRHIFQKLWKGKRSTNGN